MPIKIGAITEDSGDSSRFLQVGDIMMSGRSTPRIGFLQCDGSAVSRVVYANLFTAIGTNFGPGDGLTTFNIPDYRGRSPMGDGTGPGLSPRAIGDSLGEELHVLSVAELAIHTHLQNSHNHTQDAHNHTQDAHTHTVTDPGHNHTQNSHNHTQDAHTHIQDDHNHPSNITGPTLGATQALNNLTGFRIPRLEASADESVTTTQSQTATNQNTTATNQGTTATNNSNTTGVTNQNTTATNQATTATNQATTATNQNTGSDTGHNTIHPVLVCLFQIKF